MDVCLFVYECVSVGAAPLLEFASAEDGCFVKEFIWYTNSF